MPLPIITVPLYPNVPMVLGVPFVLRSLAFPPTPAPQLAFSDGAAIRKTGVTHKWGIYDTSGVNVLQADSAYIFSFANESRISDYPIEQGGFESYNKVATPFDARVVLIKGGTEATRQDFLDKLELILSQLTLWDVVTPEKTYSNVNVIRYDYERSARNGVSLIQATIMLREVRQAAATEFGQSAVLVPNPLVNTQAPSGADATVVGTVQPQGLTPAEITAVSQSWGGGIGWWQ